MDKGAEEQFPWLVYELDDNFFLLYWMSLAGPMNTGCVTCLLAFFMLHLAHSLAMVVSNEQQRYSYCIATE